MAKIFVYGTLRKDMYNYHLYLKGHSQFVDYGYIKGSLYSIQNKVYPAYLPSGQTLILGEIYEVDETTLARVDEMEGYHGTNSIHNEYNKELCDIFDGDGQKIDTLFVYVYNIQNPQLVNTLEERIVSGDYVEYINKKKNSDTFL